MKILVVGGGGREHTLAWKLAASPGVEQVLVAPGNGGTDGAGEGRIRNVDFQVDDFPGLIDLVRRESVGLTVVGPEAPLAAGLGDLFLAAGLPCFGPVRPAARLESDKAYAKEFMLRHGIPTARAACFTGFEPARRYVEEAGHPVVVKAAGLAAGKGVIVTDTPEEARDALRRIMVDREFGEAGAEVVIEERLTGQEASVLAFCDGSRVLAMPASQDHKPAFDGDRGPNTGGMGAYAPAPLVTPEMMSRVVRQVLEPTVRGLAAEGHPYVGVLYAGLMISGSDYRVLEFNCRFGDPETQVVLPLLESDLAEILLACIEGRLDRVEPVWSQGAAVAVVAASGGYPGSYEKGLEIRGVAQAEALEGITLFHAGTHREETGRLVTSGGRVLAVTGRAGSIPEAIRLAYRGIRAVRFQGMQYRRDIGAKAAPADGR